MYIGIMGFGFVGQAVATSFTPPYAKDVTIGVYDPDPVARAKAEAAGYKVYDYHGDMGRPDAVFVCVPTPFLESAESKCDSHMLEEAVAAALEITATVICKSTAPPSVYKQFDPCLVAYVPEFLRQATATEDYLNQTSFVVGSDHHVLTDTVVKVLQASVLCDCDVWRVSRTAAVIAKYAHNVALAVKVSVMNEMYGLAVAHDTDWEDVRTVLNDTAVGMSHTQVPGPDGTRGFGGACFPKDLQAALAEISHLRRTSFLVLNTPVMEAATRWSQEE